MIFCHWKTFNESLQRLLLMFPRREGAGAGFALRLTGQARRGSLAGRLELSPEGKHTDFFFFFFVFLETCSRRAPHHRVLFPREGERWTGTGTQERDGCELARDVLGCAPQSFPGLFLVPCVGRACRACRGGSSGRSGPAHAVLAARFSDGHLIPGPSAKASSGQCLFDQVRSMVPPHS